MSRKPTSGERIEQTHESAGRRSSDGTAPTRRTFMKATSAAVVGSAFGLGVTGSAAGVGIETPWLERDGNQLVDPTGQQVILRGVNIADPARLAREWRGKGPMDVFDLATNTDEGWHNRILRIPTQPQDISGVNNGLEHAHGDDWGPLLPGQFSRNDLESYLDQYIDPIVEAAAEVGVYIMIDYHRHFPIFHQPQHENNERLDEWDCGNENFADYDVGMCGERGVMWHGEDQVDDILDIVDADEFDGYGEELYTEEYASELDDELHMYWETVAPRYAEESHVLYDVYNEPTGPYTGDWGAPDRTPGGDGDTDEDAEERDPQPHNDPAYGDPNTKAWWDLWKERAQPWVDTIREHAPRNIVTVGSPRWSQYTYWAPHNEFEGDNIAYTGHVYTHDGLRPLDEFFGTPAEEVPIFFSEFGWAEGGGRDGFNFLDGTADEYADDFESFIEEYPVHPIAWCFDHTWEPTFFVHEESQDGDWVLHDYQERPGQWWKEFLEKHRDNDLPAGSDGGDDGNGDDDDDDDDDDGNGDADEDVNAQLQPSTTEASVGERITFHVEDTTGNSTWIDSLEWEFGDGTTASGWWNAHSYDAAGTYTVALLATDNEGMTTTHEVTITVS